MLEKHNGFYKRIYFKYFTKKGTMIKKGDRGLYLKKKNYPPPTLCTWEGGDFEDMG